MNCPTVEIQAKSTDDNPTGIVVINESDFDAETMTLVVTEPAAPVEPVEPTAPASAPWAKK